MAKSAKKILFLVYKIKNERIDPKQEELSERIEELGIKIESGITDYNQINNILDDVNKICKELMKWDDKIKKLLKKIDKTYTRDRLLKIIDKRNEYLKVFVEKYFEFLKSDVNQQNKIKWLLGLLEAGAILAKYGELIPYFVEYLNKILKKITYDEADDVTKKILKKIYSIDEKLKELTGKRII